MPIPTPIPLTKRTANTEKQGSSLSLSNAVAAAVRAALARDHRTTRAVIAVDYVAGLGGCILLRGQVRTASEKHAALEVARQAAGAAVVIDHLDVRADAPRKNWTAATMGTPIAAGCAPTLMVRALALALLGNVKVRMPS